MRIVSADTIGAPAAVLPPGAQTACAGWVRWAVPTLADALFLVVLVRGLQLGATGFFNDPGTGWHLQTGSRIIASGAVPITDPFSFTRAGQAWVETQWLADVGMAWAFRLGGYGLIALATAVLLAGLFRWLYRTQISSGGWPAIALLTTLIAVCAASGHFLARPLLASTVGVRLCFWWATQYARGATGAGRLLLLVLVAAVWCNLHPGVIGGIATVALCGLALVAHGLITRAGPGRHDRLRRGTTLLAVGAAMSAATLANPYGLGWHAWVLKLMRMGSLAKYVDEWMPPVWSDPDTLATGLLLVAVVVGTICCWTGKASSSASAHGAPGFSPCGLLNTNRAAGFSPHGKTNGGNASAATVLPNALNPAEAVVILFWVSQAAQNYRHLPLLTMILVIQLGRVLASASVRVDSGRPRRMGSCVPLFSAEIREAERRAGGGLVSVAVVVLLTVLLAAGITVPAVGLGVAGPPPARYSRGAIEYLRQHPPAGRIFNEINYGGLLIHELPSVSVFIDDRFDVYGEPFVEQYVAGVRDPGSHAADLLDRWRIDTVLIGTDAPLTDWLANRPEWTRVYRDRIAVVYARPSDAKGNTRDAD